MTILMFRMVSREKAVLLTSTRFWLVGLCIDEVPDVALTLCDGFERPGDVADKPREFGTCVKGESYGSGNEKDLK